MEKKTLNNSNIIKNISYDQSEILNSIMVLYNNGEAFDCDMTASELKFYESKNGEYIVPKPKYLFDVFPSSDEITKITPFNKLPLEDGSIHSIVVDLPFVVSPKTCKSATEGAEGSNMISKRFSSWYPYIQFYYNAYWWIRECERVLDEGGIIVWKMQDTVSGGVNHHFVEFSNLVADKLGLYTIDEFILEAKVRLISAGKYKNGQKHARKYTSTFYVFQKNKKMERFSLLNLLDKCEKEVFEGMVMEDK